MTTTTEMGKPETTRSKRIVNVTVVSVNDNKVVAKDAAGKATEYTIPEDFKFQFEGREIGVADLKPGMHVSATVTTTTTMTPVYVTEIRTGRVVAVSGQNVIVRGPDGNRVFSNVDVEKRKARIMRDGKEVSLIELRPGDNLTAVIVTDEPLKVVSEREVQAIVSAALQPAQAPAAAPAAAPTDVPAAAAPADVPAAAAPADTPAPAAAPAAEAPETAKKFPMAGWLIAILIVVLLLVFLLRRKVLTASVSMDRRAAGPSGPAVTALAQLREDRGYAPRARTQRKRMRRRLGMPFSSSERFESCTAKGRPAPRRVTIRPRKSK